VGVVFALDVGEKRIGLAKTDEIKLLAMPFCVVQRESALTELPKIFEENSAEKIVVGMPYLPSGGLGSQAKDVVDFIGKMKENISLPVVTENEVLTSIEAERRLKEIGEDFSKGDIDIMAAVIILESYLRKGE
jgi:putative Holliday junction resolvase